MGGEEHKGQVLYKVTIFSPDLLNLSQVTQSTNSAYKTTQKYFLFKTASKCSSKTNAKTQN